MIKLTNPFEIRTFQTTPEENTMAQESAAGGRKSAIMSLLSTTAIVSALAFSAPAFAQDEPGARDNIVVTARKREESLFETPAAISALTPETLADRNISNLDDIGKHVPNLNITRYGVGNTAQAAVFIRGIGLQDHIITTDPGVGVYLDGVYLGRQLGSNLSLISIDRIEVLRGPQGTLYGRNSIGGAINIITRQPNGGEGAILNVQGGSRGRAAINTYLEFPMFENFNVGVSGYFKRRNGVGDFLLLDNPDARVGEEQEFGGRIKAAWDVNDRFSLVFSFDGLQADNGQSPYVVEVNGIGVSAGDDFTPGTPIESRNNPFAGDFFALQPGFSGNVAPFLPAAANGQLFAPNPDDSFSTVAGLETTTNAAWGGSVTADLELNDNFSTRLLASYRKSEYTGGLDDDETPFNLSEFPENGEAEQASVEWQINANVGGADFVGGVYYFYEDGFTNSGPFVFSPFNTPGSIDNFGVPFNLGFPTGLGNFDLNQTTNAYAVYGNVKYAVSDAFTIGGGLRYSWDNKDADALFPSFPARTFREADFEELTWDVNLSYALTDNLNVYAQVQKGYQTGGFPPRPFGGPAQFVSFDEQTAINYEAGVKGAINEYLTVMLSGFWTRYRDLALPFSDTTAGGGFVTIVENAGRSRARGFELETVLSPFDGLTLNAAVGYNDAEITEVDPGTIGIAVGDRPALTPRWTLSLAPHYEFELANGGTLAFNADYSYRGDQFGQSINTQAELLKSRDLLGFSIDYTPEGGDWTFSVYGENITNEIYDVGRLQQTGFVGVVRSNDRSEFGVRLSKRFGDL